MVVLAGDCTQVATETIAIVRRLPHPSGNRYRLVFVFSTPEDNFSGCSLCDQHLPAFTDMFDQMLERVVNGPGFLDMRGVDAKMYLVLSMRAFNRGPPMIPHNSPCSEESFHISVGEHLGLLSWIRFKPHEKFCLSEYLRCFMERLGYQLKIYGVMDGRKLVPYQCVVVRSEWDQSRASFYEAFKVQKAAYRCANGGPKSPNLIEAGLGHVPNNMSHLCLYTFYAQQRGGERERERDIYIIYIYIYFIYIYIIYILYIYIIYIYYIQKIHIYLPTHPPTYLPTYLHTNIHTYTSVYIYIYIDIDNTYTYYLHKHIYIYISTLDFLVVM